jgi:hypothetical protein
MIESNATMMDVFRSIDRVNVSVASDDAASELIMRLRPPTSNGTDMVSELALFEDKISVSVSRVSLVRTPPESKKLTEMHDIQHRERCIRKREEWSISAEGSNIETVFTIPESISNGP